MASIIANLTPVPMTEGPKLVLHLLPFEAFDSEHVYDIRQQFPIGDLRPLSAQRGWGKRLTFEGKLVTAAAGDDAPPSYVHLYRTGVIEVVDASILSHTMPENPGQQYIPSIGVERYIFEGPDRGIRILQRLGADGPTALAVPLTQTKGMVLGFNERWTTRHQSPVLNDHLFLPEAILSELGAPVRALMKPAIDLIWNACGLEESEYLNAEGHWTPPQ